MKPTFHLIALMSLLWFSCQALASSLAAEPLQPSAKERCAVCGMMVSPYPGWIAVVTFNDNPHKFFDGPKDMFLFIFDRL